MAESKKQEEVENFPNQQDEGVNVRVSGFSTESVKKIQKPNDVNKLSEEEPSPAEDQDFGSVQEEPSSESSGLVKGLIGVLYKG